VGRRIFSKQIGHSSGGVLSSLKSSGLLHTHWRVMRFGIFGDFGAILFL
jgi:hypothetical protein